MVKKRMGRPTKYNPELAADICKQLAQGISLRTVCLPKEMPDLSIIFDWLAKYPDFAKQYAWAKQESSDAMAEEILDLSDESVRGAYKADPKAAGAVVQAHRLQVDTRKWLMSKMKPKRYGEKVDVTSAGEAIKGNSIIFKDFDVKSDQ